MVVETAQTVQKQPSDGEVAVVHVKPDQSNKAPRNKRRISASVVCWVAVAIVVLWLICATGYYFRQSRHYYNELIKTQERCNGSSSARKRNLGSMKIFSNSTMTPPDKNKTATPSHRTDSTLLPPSTIHNRVAVKHSKAKKVFEQIAVTLETCIVLKNSKKNLLNLRGRPAKLDPTCLKRKVRQSNAKELLCHHLHHFHHQPNFSSTKPSASTGTLRKITKIPCAKPGNSPPQAPRLPLNHRPRMPGVSMIFSVSHVGKKNPPFSGHSFQEILKKKKSRKPSVPEMPPQMKPIIPNFPNTFPSFPFEMKPYSIPENLQNGLDSAPPQGQGARDV